MTFSADVGTAGIRSDWGAAALAGVGAISAPETVGAGATNGVAALVSTTTGCSRFAKAAAGSFWTGLVVLVSSMAPPKPIPNAVTTVAIPRDTSLVLESLGSPFERLTLDAERMFPAELARNASRLTQHFGNTTAMDRSCRERLIKSAKSERSARIGLRDLLLAPFGWCSERGEAQHHFTAALYLGRRFDRP
jgi:hypothetical protein